MLFREKILELVVTQKVEKVLTIGSHKTEYIRALQIMLYKLGFAGELKWDVYKADGKYGRCTAGAVKAFANRNGLSSDGKTVTREIAEKMVARFDVLEHMRYLYNTIKKCDIGKKIYQGSNDTVGIKALQTLLNSLGFGQTLNYMVDGNYGNNTAAAVAFFSFLEELKCPQCRLTNQQAERIIKQMENFYGDDWATVS